MEELHFGTTLAKPKSKSVVRMRGFVRDAEDPVVDEQAPPAVWLINRLQVDEDGDPLMEGIFANYNDDIILEADSNTLIGRYSPARGPAESLIIGEGLRVEDGVLIGEGGGEKGDPGPPGPQGPQGPMGPGGASSSAFDYRADTQVQSTTTDPGAGKFRWNNATQQSATMLSIDRMTMDNFDPTAMFTTAQFHDEIIIQEKTLAAHFQEFTMTGPAVPMGGGDWFTVPVQFVRQGGGSFSNNTVCSILVRTKGEKGDQGVPGPEGPQGPPGSMGPAGPQGPVGGQGPVGPTGLKGDTGAQGIQGPVGPKGDKGDKGDTGNQGLQGVQGPKGDKGDKGDRGESWHSGAGDPVAGAVPGAISGDWYLDTTDGQVWEFVGTTWTLRTDITGPQGEQGIQGETGPPGDFGSNEAPMDGEIYGRSMGAWTLVESGGASVSISDTPPVAEKPGDLWYNSATGFIFVWVDDGTSTQWVITNPVVPVAGPPGADSTVPGPEGPQGPQGEASTVPGPQGPEGPQGPQGIEGPEGPGSRVNTQDDPPAGPADGDLWWESDSGRLHIMYRDADDNRYWVQAAASVADVDNSTLVKKSGDAMSGLLLLSGDPTTGLHAATKQYTDTALASKAVRYDAAQAITAAQQLQARQNVYAAPFDSMGYFGIQFNGSGEIDQASVGNVTANNSFPYFTDGWIVWCGGAVQALASPYTDTLVPGFQKYVRIYTTAAVTTLAAGDFGNFIHYIEGVRMARLSWGNANAQPLTIGFWIRVPFAGNAAVTVASDNASRCYTVDVACAANTWQWKTITIPGDQAGTWPVTTALGAQIIFCFGSGSTYRGTANAWSSTFTFSTAATSNFLNLNGTQCQIGGLMVLPGNEAPSAERSAFVKRPYEQDLLICKRYFYNGIVPLVGCCSASTAAARMKARHPVTMRIAPSLTLASPLPVFNGVTATTLTSIGTNYSTTEVAELDGNVAAASGINGMWGVYQGSGGNLVVSARM